MSLDEAYAELVDATGLADSQVALGLSRDDVVRDMFAAWKKRVARLGALSSIDKKRLSDAIVGGPWTTDQKKDLGQTVMNKVALDTNIHTGSEARRSNQRCQHPEHDTNSNIRKAARHCQRVTRIPLPLACSVRTQHRTHQPIVAVIVPPCPTQGVLRG